MATPQMPDGLSARRDGGTGSGELVATGGLFLALGLLLLCFLPWRPRGTPNHRHARLNDGG